jgi:RES domain-containing protein
MLAPRWSHAPLSGDGAAKHGGRWNAPGIAALYMSEKLTTAIAEYEQDLGIRPGTLCAYEVNARSIADLTAPSTLGELGVAHADLLAPWKQIFLVERQKPATWDVAGKLIASGVYGVRVPSARAAGTNLVLWRWNLDRKCRVKALDPLGDLPKDQRSWQERRRKRHKE